MLHCASHLLLPLLAGFAFAASPVLAAEPSDAESGSLIEEQAQKDEESDPTGEDATNASPAAGGSAASPCGVVLIEEEDEGAPASPPAPTDDPCVDPSAGSTTSGSYDGGIERTTPSTSSPMSVSIALLLSRGWMSLPAPVAGAGVLTQELTVMRQGRLQRLAKVRYVVQASGRATPHIRVTKQGRVLLRRARVTLKATVRTTFVRRGGGSSTSRQAVLLVPKKR